VAFVFLSLACLSSRGVFPLQQFLSKPVSFGIPPGEFKLLCVPAWHILLLHSSVGDPGVTSLPWIWCLALCSPWACRCV
jgi:hypothetical protein